MDRFEMWLTRLIGYLETQKKGSDRIYAIVYDYGHELMLEVLRQYRATKKSEAEKKGNGKKKD